jgi:uncharacterized membrane protein YkvA (DUF1232 family)
MHLPLRKVKTILLEVPVHGKLAYSLLRDPRVPLAPKVALLAALGVVVSPLDLPGWVPLVGELDMLALALLAVKVFVDACPDALVAEHRRALGEGRSTFDSDFRRVAGVVRRGVVALLGGRPRPGHANEAALPAHYQEKTGVSGQ